MAESDDIGTPRDEPAQADQLFEMVLARISTIETALMLLWNEQPNRAEIRATAKKILEIRDTIGLAETATDLSLTTREEARLDSFGAIFHELFSEKGHAVLRKDALPPYRT